MLFTDTNFFPALDIVSEEFEPLKQVPHDKLAATILVLGQTYSDGHYFMLYQIKSCKAYTTYMKYATNAEGSWGKHTPTVVVSQQTHNPIMTSLSRKNDVILT